jgi:hypothetical protein
VCISIVVTDRPTPSSAYSPQLLAYRSSSPCWLCVTLWSLRRMEMTLSTRPPLQVRALDGCVLPAPSLKSWVFCNYLWASDLTPSPDHGYRCSNPRELVVDSPDSLTAGKDLGHLAFPKSYWSGQSSGERTGPHVMDFPTGGEAMYWSNDSLPTSWSLSPIVLQLKHGLARRCLVSEHFT